MHLVQALWRLAYIGVVLPRLASRLGALDMPQKPVINVLYGGMRKFKQVTCLSKASLTGPLLS